MRTSCRPDAACVFFTMHMPAAHACLPACLADLRLVAPRDGWPNPAATATASNAQDVLAAARVYRSLGEAVADLNCLYAATARTR